MWKPTHSCWPHFAVWPKLLILSIVWKKKFHFSAIVRTKIYKESKVLQGKQSSKVLVYLTYVRLKNKQRKTTHRYPGVPLSRGGVGDGVARVRRFSVTGALGPTLIITKKQESLIICSCPLVPKDWFLVWEQLGTTHNDPQPPKTMRRPKPANKHQENNKNTNIVPRLLPWLLLVTHVFEGILFSVKFRSGAARGFEYTVSGLWSPFNTGLWHLFVTIRVWSILFFLDFRYSVYRYELNVYFSVEAAHLARQCFTIFKYFGILWKKSRVCVSHNPPGWAC